MGLVVFALFKLRKLHYPKCKCSRAVPPSDLKCLSLKLWKVRALRAGCEVPRGRGFLTRDGISLCALGGTWERAAVLTGRVCGGAPRAPGPRNEDSGFG